MAHDHDHHDHAFSHGHHHGQHGAVKNIKVAFFLNLAFTIIEIFGGIFTNSVAILSDALHDLGDTLGLGLAWYLERVAGKERDRAYSYGYARFSVLAAVINALILLIGVVFILFETIPRFSNPEPTNVEGMIVFAVIGVLVNGAAVLQLRKGDTLNERVVMVHLLEDVLGWVAILIGSIVMLFVDVPILDPILSSVIVFFVIFNVYRNLRKSIPIFLQGIPSAVDYATVKEKILAIDGVQGIHDLHIWSLDGRYNVATLHIVVDTDITLLESEELKADVRHAMKHLDIEHVTIEVESEDADCGNANCN